MAGASRPIVYLGPSLPVSRARPILDADYRPPIKRGDLPTRWEGTIVIIDGEFGQSLAVSPKEILRLLDAGTTVIGAASMGALRALELSVYGMRGCGRVVEMYALGEIDADDEVAVTYSPDDLTCLTVPLVNVRGWLAELARIGLLDPATRGELLAAARGMFYADRTRPRLLERLGEVAGPRKIATLLAATGGEITDVKAADAEHALELAESLSSDRMQTPTKEEDDVSSGRAHAGAQRGVLTSRGR